MTRIIHIFLLTLIAISISGCADFTKKNNNDASVVDKQVVNTPQQFTFAWSFTDSSTMKPRGGTTFGQKTTLDKSPNKEWLALREKNLVKFERDRRAILAMTGAYRVSFDFIETLGFTENYIPTQPYQSWGTEYVYLVEDKNDFISLQHILVMFFSSDDDYDSPEPMVVKHWRQDWKYEDETITEFSGFKTWKKKVLSTKEVKGKWSQSVFQVDDSPRYQAIGFWEHKGNYSSWLSNETWRPLPRREFSVRNDYNVLIGTNRHTVTPTGWVQEEDNLKVILSAPEKLKKNDPIIAKETGVARYQRILDHDWSAGDKYWNDTGPFWQKVRNTWNKLLDEQPTISFKETKDVPPLFMTMFSMAQESTSINSDPNIELGKIEKTIKSYLSNF